MSGPGFIESLCRELGIQPRYTDQSGQRHEASPETLRAMLAALGHRIESEADAAAALAALKRQSVERMIEPVAVLRPAREPPAITVTLCAADGAGTLAWRITEERGVTHEGGCRFAELPLVAEEMVDGARWERRKLTLPAAIPLGYHRLELRLTEGPAQAAAMRLILAPDRAYLPVEIEQGPGLWELAIQLYAVRSERNWGIGDFTDLLRCVSLAAGAGAGFLCLNPLHALYPDEPERASPYSPSSRRFLNSLYIDPEAVPDFAACDAAREAVAAPAFQQELRRLRAGALIDYAAVARCKQAIFERLYHHFRERHLDRRDRRADAFRAFQRAAGPALRELAIFQALRESRSREAPVQRDWRNWPDELKDPLSATVVAFALSHSARIEYHEYLQWQASIQLKAAAEAAWAGGMPVGLYVDLAVGVDAGGAEAWGGQGLLVPGWSIGAPPDEWNLKGQAWGLPPFDPAALRRQGYAAFIDTLRATMRHAGGLRIDHVLGFKRLFWVREGTGPEDGLYLAYPFEDLVGIVALESHRNRCLVVGEDLGTLPEGLPEALQAAGILSYRLLYFTRGPDGRFEPPQAYPRQAAVAVSTHDLPTLAAWWEGRDLELRERLDLYPTPERRERDRAERPEARRRLAAALREQGLIDADAPPDLPPVEAVYRFLARTPCRLLVLQAEDLLGIVEQVNVPGTTHEHPNWRRRLPVPIEAMFESPTTRRLLDALAEERPAARPAVPSSAT